jgi:hypothetical protein
LGSSVPEGFSFSPDGQYLYGSSYFTGVSNIFRYRLSDESVEAVSNADLGFFHPLAMPDGKLMVLRYAGAGFLPTVIEPKPTEDLGSITFLGEQVATRHPEVQKWQPAPVTASSLDARITGRGDYRPLQEMQLNSLTPGVAAYKHAKAVGLTAQFSDPLNRVSVKTELSYTPGNSLPVKERTHISVDFGQGLWMAGLKWNAADFYDLFGPTLRSREGYSAYIDYSRPLVYDPPQTLDFNFRATYYGGLNALPGAQTVASPSHLSDIRLGLVSSDTLRSPGAVDAESGTKWSLQARSLGARGKQTPSLRGQYDFGIPLPLNHSSIWIRSGFNIAEGSANSALSNAYLGSFGNNYVDNAANGGAQRYRDLLSMPGFDIDVLQGKTLVKTMVEWSLPPLNFENVGTPGAYASWMRPEIFASYLTTDLQDKTRRRNAASVGLQLDFELQVMHRLPMMFSLGFARGFGGGGLGKNEVMLSFQVL